MSLRFLSCRFRGAHGQVAPLFAAAVVVAMLTMVGVVGRGVELAGRAAAQAAADAAALAGALEGPVAARRVAEANAAVVVSYEERALLVRVEVERAGERAVAVAESVVDRG